MSERIAKCPLCGSTNINSTTRGKAVGTAVSTAAYGVVFGGQLLINAHGIDVNIPGKSSIINAIKSLAPIECVCGACDCLVSTVFNFDGELKEVKLKKYPLPENIIEEERDAYIGSIRKSRPYVSAIIFGLLTLYCVVYFFAGIANASSLTGGAQIVFGLIFGIVFGILTVLKFRKISFINGQIETAEHQTLREFKNSHKDLFVKYSQYH